MKSSNKKIESNYFRNKHSKEMRKILKNKGIVVNAKSICNS